MVTIEVLFVSLVHKNNHVNFQDNISVLNIDNNSIDLLNLSWNMFDYF